MTFYIVNALLEIVSHISPILTNRKVYNLMQKILYSDPTLRRNRNLEWK